MTTLLLVVAVLLVAVRAVALLRAQQRAAPRDSVEGFHRALDALAPSAPPRRRR